MTGIVCAENWHCMCRELALYVHRTDLHCMSTERWQDHDRSMALDVVLAYDERVFDAVVQDLQSRYRMCSLTAIECVL